MQFKVLAFLTFNVFKKEESL